MWQRYNGTTKIFERSDDNGGSWAPLDLDAAIITQGTFALARIPVLTSAKLPANVAYVDVANTFTLNQLISKTRPELQLLHSGTSKGRLHMTAAGQTVMSNNTSHDGTNWNLDDTSAHGSIIFMSSGSEIGFYHIPSGANPRTPAKVLGISLPSALLDVPGGQIVFPAAQNASANANTLDDYEEGTWTPSYTPAAGAGITYSQQGGSYVKIGKFVLCQFVLTVSGLGTASGVVKLAGLPFAPGPALGEYGSGTFGYWVSATTALVQIPWLLTAGVSSMDLLKVTGATASSGGAQLTVADLSAAFQLIGTFMYRASA